VKFVLPPQLCEAFRREAKLRCQVLLLSVCPSFVSSAHFGMSWPSKYTYLLNMRPMLALMSFCTLAVIGVSGSYEWEQVMATVNCNKRFLSLGFWSWRVMFRLSGLDPVERWVFSISANFAVSVFNVNDFVRRLVVLCSSCMWLLRHIASRETRVRAIQLPPSPTPKAINMNMATGRLESRRHSTWPSPEESLQVMTVIHISVLDSPPVLKRGYRIRIDSNTDNA
jgi:hypothetical protein